MSKIMTKTLSAIAAAAVFLALWAPPAPAQSPAKLKTYRNPLGMEFVLLPAGSFLMGSRDKHRSSQGDESQHQVTITKAFYMQTTEVTQGQWWGVQGKKFFGARKGPDDLPVSRVSWNEARDFAAKLNRKMAEAGQPARYRLPTEAEWEYACRAGSQGRYCHGQAIECAQAMFANNTLKDSRCGAAYKKLGIAPDGPAKVKSFPPNAWGLFDLHGNLWEWVADWYGPYPGGAVSDPTGAAEGFMRVRRGGSWFGGKGVLRCANRNRARPQSMYGTTGFRLVLEPAPDQK